MFTRRQFAAALLPALGGVFASGCGTILYPERRGQPSGQLDWGVVALNGIGLIFFFVPGVIAFAVDFITGAIYLPEGGYGRVDGEQRSELRRIDVPREQLTRARVARIVSDAGGRSVSLQPGTYDTRALANLDAFWRTRDEFATVAVSLDGSDH